MKEIQRREDLARKMALEEAEKRMALTQQLADEKRRLEIEKLHKEHEREKRHEAQTEIERIRQEIAAEKEHARAKKAALKLRISEVTAASEIKGAVSYTHLTLPTNREV